MSFRPRRSILYLPGSNVRALEKAKSLPADGLILDLEDAVAPEAKVTAREQIHNALKDGGYGRREVVIRINGFDTEWADEDMKMACEAKPDAILVPKISSPEDVHKSEAAMKAGGASEKTHLWAMMETALAMTNTGEIAKCAKLPEAKLNCFVFGTNDLSKETMASPRKTRAAMVPWIAMTVVAARAYGLATIDGVYNNFQDMIGFREECIQGRDLGMDGKSLIHPSQIRPSNEIFAPDPEEVRWSKKLIAAFELPENQGKGAIAVDGRMFELHHAEVARRVVAMADIISEMSNEASG